jgi:hypothetical protein
MDEPHDLTALSNADLKEHIDRLQHEERDVSYRRRMIHGHLDLARNELIRRRKGQEPGELASVDLDELSRILAGRLTDLSRLEGDAPAE